MLRPALATILLTTTAAMAEVPRVTADIAPVHSLVAQVMGDLGEPALLVRPGASPHGYSLRPSEARALDQAELVVMVGESLTPWLMQSVETLAGDARVMHLLDAPGTTLLEQRSGATFDRHDHAHDDEDHDDHSAEAHDDHHDHGGAHGPIGPEHVPSRARPPAQRGNPWATCNASDI